MRSLKGVVTSDKMKNTIVVTINRYKSHPKYKKRFKVSSKVYVDCPENTYKVGDTVTVYETRPLSKTKCWTTVKPTTTTKQ